MKEKNASFAFATVSVNEPLEKTSIGTKEINKGLFTLTAEMATAMAMEEWVTLDHMEVFTWRSAAMGMAMATHRVQYNPLFPLVLRNQCERASRPNHYG